jgi:hypothetical protein
VPIWEEIAKSINESPKMLDDNYFDNLIDNVTAEIDDRHENIIPKPRGAITIAAD